MVGVHKSLENIRNHFVVRNLIKGLTRLWSTNTTRFAVLYLLFLIVLGLFGPSIAPYGYQEIQYNDQGELKRAIGPTLEHPLGTTDVGYDVLSRVIIGARPTVLTGLFGGMLIIGIGATIGITAGYVGGRVENTLMRITDFVYSVPLIPFAIVLLSLFSMGFWGTIFVIGILLWRGNARVLRSQVLQIKERPFVMSAKAMGSSRTRIILKHIFPNVAAMATLFFALGVGYSIIAQAGLAFIGVSNPFVPSWGVMIRNAYRSGFLDAQWMWALAPGMLISITVLSAFMIGREFEVPEGEGQI